MNQKRTLKTVLLENLSYKVVSLFVAIILWFTIMGRRDLILTRNINIEFKTAISQKLVGQTADQVRVRLSGSRSALKEVIGETSPKGILIDISDRGEGTFDIEVPLGQIEIPQGVRILSIRPSLVRVEVVKSP